MIQKFYSKLDLQLAALAAMLASSALFAYLFNFVPLLRPSFWTFLIGLLGGVALVVIKVVSEYSLHKDSAKGIMRFNLPQRPVNNITLGQIIVQAAGEETLLRGFIFVPLVVSMNFFGSTLLALSLNAIISIVLYSTREKIDYVAGIQATLLAIIYLHSYSIFALVTARLVGELLLLLASHYELPKILKRRFTHVTTREV